MDKFTTGTADFVKQINNSLIERGQLIDSMEILLDKVSDFSVEESHCKSDFRKIQSLLEVLLVSFKNNQAVDEDLAAMFEQKYLFPNKRELTTEKRKLDMASMQL